MISSMKIAITGASGLLGHALVRVIGAIHDRLPMTRADAALPEYAFQTEDAELGSATAVVAGEITRTLGTFVASLYSRP